MLDTLPGEIRQFLKEHPNLLEKLTNKKTLSMIKKFGICSFSKNWNSILQWGYYGNSHTGICFGFSLKKDPVYFANDILEVVYQKNYPNYNYVSGRK